MPKILIFWCREIPTKKEKLFWKQEWSFPSGMEETQISLEWKCCKNIQLFDLQMKCLSIKNLAQFTTCPNGEIFTAVHILCTAYVIFPQNVHQLELVPHWVMNVDCICDDCVVWMLAYKPDSHISCGPNEHDLECIQNHSMDEMNKQVIMQCNDILIRSYLIYFRQCRMIPISIVEFEVVEDHACCEQRVFSASFRYLHRVRWWILARQLFSLIWRKWLNFSMKFRASYSFCSFVQI